MPDDKISLQFSSDGLFWFDIGNGAFGGVRGVLPGISNGSVQAGVTLSTVGGNSTDLDIFFNRYYSAETDGPGSDLDWVANTYWRVVKIKKGLALGFANVTATNPGLAPATASLGRFFVGVGTGSAGTNTAIATFSTIFESAGNDITYVQDGSLGDSFTINADGLYAMMHSNIFNASNNMGISRNSSQLSTNIEAIANADAIALTVTTGNDESGSCSTTMYLVKGDVIRAHAVSGFTQGSDNGRAKFMIQRIL